ncbi:hypothetical protein Pmani_035499 [Petrolisthes manimaculis]|uniref:Uncharacterized protein n=1 Tax=Petrolisthes manimaculis TaxID=1843537 RepID=A0AAE1NM76_9EUCA|nr:hypothetical protein Pmani_035499 [Petrolisthes manimaculis]
MSISPVLTLSISHCLIFPPYLTLPPPLPFLTPSATPCLSPSSTYLTLLHTSLPHLGIQLCYTPPTSPCFSLHASLSPSLLHFACLTFPALSSYIFIPHPTLASLPHPALHCHHHPISPCLTFPGSLCMAPSPCHRGCVVSGYL